MKSRALICVLLLCAGLPAYAQENQESSTTTDQDAPRRFWQAVVPGGHYMVAIDRISSISRQSYLLDGTVVVHEVTVDTVGQALARFYYLEPLATGSSTANQAVERARELVNQAGQRTGTNAQDMVVKKYPDTTHAKALEFRLKDEAELEALYKSLREAWESGKGRKFSVK